MIVLGECECEEGEEEEEDDPCKQTGMANRCNHTNDLGHSVPRCSSRQFLYYGGTFVGNLLQN